MTAAPHKQGGGVVSELEPDTRIFIAGHGGLAGSAIWRRLAAAGHTSLIGRGSKEVDLRDAKQVDDLFASELPEAVILAAAKVGGIAANAAFPLEYLADNLRIELNVMEAARRHGVERFVFIGSAAAYPASAESPIPESALMSGPPEQAHAGYALAKLAGVHYVMRMHEQGHAWYSLMPTNIYGRNDNFHPQWSHVVPALLRKFHEARLEGRPSVTVWGTGKARREFVHADDVATACRLLLDGPDAPSTLNVGTEEEVDIRSLSTMVKKVVGYEGEVEFDVSRPDGIARRALDSSALRALGWQPNVDLETGLVDTYRWLSECWPDVRS